MAMFDVEVVDAKGNRCPTFEDSVDFTCSGEGMFLGGYNSGIRYSTNDKHLTKRLSSQCRVRHQPGLRAGQPVTPANHAQCLPGPGRPRPRRPFPRLRSPSGSGLMTQTPQFYTVALGPEPAPKSGRFTTSW